MVTKRNSGVTIASAPRTWMVVQRAIYILGLGVSGGAFYYGVPLLKCVFILLASVAVALALAGIQNAISSKRAASIVTGLVVIIFIAATSGIVWTWFRPCDLPAFADALGLSHLCTGNATVSCNGIPDLPKRETQASLPGSDPKINLRLQIETCHIDTRFSVPTAITALRLYEHIMQTFDLANHLKVNKPEIIINNTKIATYEDWVLLADGHLVSDGIAHREGDLTLSAIPVQEGALLTFKLNFHAAIQATKMNDELLAAVREKGTLINDIAL